MDRRPRVLVGKVSKVYTDPTCHQAGATNYISCQFFAGLILGWGELACPSCHPGGERMMMDGIFRGRASGETSHADASRGPRFGGTAGW